MDNEDQIAESRLARLWRVDPNLLYQMRARGRLVSDGKYSGRSHFYYARTLDSLHNRLANDKAKEMGIPTVASLLQNNSTQQPSFMQAEEVANFLHVSTSVISRRTAANILPVIYITDWLPRYPAYLVRLYEQELDVIGRLTVRAKDAAKILCVDVQKVRELVKQQRLVKVEREEEPTNLFVSKSSILSLLAQLVKGMTPEQWWDLRLQSDERVLTKNEICDEYHIAYKTITPLLESGEIPCIQTTGGRTRCLTLVPESAIKQILAARSMVPAALVAELFAVDEPTAQEWLTSGKLRCSRHSSGPCPLPSCLPTYIESRSNIPVNGTAWFNRRIRDKQDVVTEPLAIHYLRTTPELLKELIASGKIAAVRLPAITDTGEWRFAAIDIVRYLQGNRTRQNPYTARQHGP